MKKVLTGIAAVLAAAVMLASCNDSALSDEVAEGTAARGTTNYTRSYQICNLVYEGYNGGSKGPISVTRGKLNNKYTCYLVCLSGTESVSNQSTGYLTDALSGFNLNNAYVTNVVKVITANVPSGSRLILAGHSLGGMVCQQVAANDTIKNRYVVMNTVTFGSPLLSAGSREGTVKRLGDVSDPVPYMSGSLINNTAWAIAGLQRENGGYGTAGITAHTQSYYRSDEWAKYDAVGTKNGSNYIALDLSTKKFYKSPTSVK